MGKTSKRLPLVFMCMFYVAVVVAEESIIASNYVEFGINYHNLSDDYPNWKGYYLKGSWQQDKKNIWDWQLLRDDRWDNWETLYGAGIAHTFNDEWYGSLHATYSDADAGFFFNNLGIAALLNRRLLTQRNLVATFGLNYFEAKDDIHVDRSMYIGAAYYFTTPWVVEAGFFRNRSSPGPAYSSRYKLAAMHGRELDRLITSEIEWGRESYQLISATTTLIDFSSKRVALTWREWLGKDWGINVVGEYYTNSIYNRSGVTLGVFKHF